MFSIIIVTYNSENCIHKCLDSIKNRSLPDIEVIVVDNSGKDYGLKDVIVNKSGSYPSGLNQGINAAKYDNLVCCNPDIIIHNQYWLHLMEHLIDSYKIGIVGPMTNFASGLQGAPINWPEQVKYIDVRFFIGFCFMLKRSTYNKIGPFDEQFIFENDDLDYSIRAYEKDCSIAIVPNVQIEHVGHQSLLSDKRINLEKRWLSFYRLFKKYPNFIFHKEFGIKWDKSWFTEVSKRYPDIKNIKSYQYAVSA